MNIYILVGTRPNFIKVTQFKSVAARLYPQFKIVIIHTGQHYDERMADVFFRQFNLVPDHFLHIVQGSPNRQIACIMEKLEDLCDKIGKPDILLVPGDVNSTLAGALFANKCDIRLGHIEAGLRSFDRTMPEEFNRVLTDQLSDLFFVTEESGINHLLKEGVERRNIHFVGNTMIDTLVAFENEIEKSEILKVLGLDDHPFVLMTMHRPATVDNRDEFQKLVDLIGYLSSKYKVVFPIHPRTMKNARDFGYSSILESNPNVLCTDPLDYFSFQKLVKGCFFIVTDSGGIQEESTFRGKPCLTLRANTERPVTVDIGTNTLLPFNLSIIRQQISLIEAGSYKTGRIPQWWDGHATKRILESIKATV